MAALTSLPNPLAPVRRRFQAWWQSRLPFTDSVTLTQRNVYILPTRPGWMMGVTVLVLLVASINYQLSLGYLLTFLLAGLSVLDPPDVDAKKGRERHWAWTDVPAQGSSVVQVAFTPPRRGLHRLPTLTAETRFPLGTFRVWTVWRPAAQILVYPAPESHPPPLPPG
jgi:uncharacterized protein (DUF58 family)